MGWCQLKDQILSRLEARRGQYVSGAELAQELGISRTAVWKHIQGLKREGYRIVAVRNQGYRLETRDSADDTEPGITGELKFGQQRLVLEEVSSTNNVAREMADQGKLAEGAIVMALRQTRGRGRRGRTWESPPGGLWFSTVLYPRLPARDVAPLSLVFSLALARALDKLIGMSVHVKWPNDVLISGKKVAGILLEMNTEFDVVRYLVAGIGVNVNLRSEDLPPELREKATSLRIAAGREFDMEEVLFVVLREMEMAYRRYLKTGFKGFRREFAERCAHFGRQISVCLQERELTGVDRGIDEYGCLRLEVEDGKILRVSSGDVILA